MPMNPDEIMAMAKRAAEESVGIECLAFRVLRLDHNDNVESFLLYINSPAEKVALFEQVLPRICIDAAAVVITHEAWTARLLPGDDRLPADRPDRQERVLIMVACEVKCMMSGARIFNHGEWQPRTLGEWEDLNKVSGRFRDVWMKGKAMEVAGVPPLTASLQSRRED